MSAQHLLPQAPARPLPADVVATLPPMRFPLTEPQQLPLAGFAPCPVCGRKFQRYVGSRLSCHAACIFAPADRRKLSVLLRLPTVTYLQVAAHYGLPTAVMYRVARRR